MTSRRAFIARAAAGAASGVVSIAALAGGLEAQTGRPGGATAPVDTTNLFAMDQAAAKSVRLPPKAGAQPSVTRAQRDELEHQLRCQCGCTLDVYTCRTTDFSCQVSPSMHRDVMALVDGGYGAQEIIDAFVSTYGERVLMAPKKSGFNLVGWLTPGIALVAGGVAVGLLLRRWGGERAALPAAPPTPRTEATREELARIEAAVRDDEG